MAVVMPHLVLHDKYQVMRSLDVEAARQRLLEPDQPKSGRTLIDYPIDTVLLLYLGCSQATGDAHLKRRLVASDGIDEWDVLHGQLQF